MRIPKLEPRESKKLPPEQLYNILENIYGESIALKKMHEFGMDVSVSTESAEDINVPTMRR